MTLQALRNRIGDADVLHPAAHLGRRPRAAATAPPRSSAALAEQVSGQDLTGFFDAWLRRTTKPADTVANGLG